MKREAFYSGSSHAVIASKPQMLEHAAEMQNILGNDIKVIAVNKLYRHSCICRIEGRFHHYSVYENKVVREHQFQGSWEEVPNYVRMEELEAGQMELF
ncbi:hypothetical protein [Paenibacillus gansuensis]|uniref:Uncharacterized protein n=1 Tax=Paenibacillus gansuensis TaxID=306542 RepID=A0ABW5PIY6_9BACL